MKSVSVIISARNAGRWLEQCLASVAAQEVPRGWRLRIMLGIDACIETLTAATRISVPNLSVHYFPEHVGPFVIFNSLAYFEPAHALVRFDADDIMLRSYLFSQLSMLGTASKPVITQTWSTYVDPDLRPMRAKLASGRMTLEDGRRPAPSDGQVLMTAAVWQRLGSFRAWWCHGDSEFLSRADWAGISRHTIPEYLYLRRMHASSLTQTANTGYRSGVRSYYSRLISEAAKRYSAGIPAEYVWPTAARFISGHAALRAFKIGRQGTML